jgi:hypothetical protein
VLFYEERYNTPQTLTRVLLETERQAGGSIFVTTSPGGPLTSPYATYSQNGLATGIYGSTVEGIYGVRVEVTATASEHLQMGGADFLSIDPGPNLAFGRPTISSAGAQLTGSVTDHETDRAWQSAENTTLNPEQFVGLEFETPQILRGIRVINAGTDAQQFGWRNFDVQIKVGGVWETVGRANMASSETVFWGTFIPNNTLVEGVRLYGSNAGGNNPTRTGGGLIINEIQVFGWLPEPATIGLLAPAAALLLRRRK